MLQQFNFQDHTVRVVLDDDTNKAINTHCGGVVILRTISDSLGETL